MHKQKTSNTFYTIAQQNGHWWFITPKGQPTFSIGMNHIDSATLRYHESGKIWWDRFGNSQERWLKEAVKKDLIDWGFNCIGWTQEVVLHGEKLTEGGILHRHGRAFIFEEYQWADLPYCHLLPFIESHQWELETQLPDLRSKEFEEWCDYVARDQCARMADDPKLIGYFYTDCPIWVHTRRPEFKPPIFDPDLLSTEAGKKELFDLATHYYKVTHDAVRRYDPNHLILGDRYEGQCRLSEEVLRAAVPYVDVLSFQNFAPIQQVVDSFKHWHNVTGLPVLLADASAKQKSNKAENYSTKIKALRELPCCVGWHLCGAYLENTTRNRGVRDKMGQADDALIAEMIEANQKTKAFVNTITND